jgi:hypothetical protein
MPWGGGKGWLYVGGEKKLRLAVANGECRGDFIHQRRWARRLVEHLRLQIGFPHGEGITTTRCIVFHHQGS